MWRQTQVAFVVSPSQIGHRPAAGFASLHDDITRTDLALPQAALCHAAFLMVARERTLLFWASMSWEATLKWYKMLAKQDRHLPKGIQRLTAQIVCIFQKVDQQWNSVVAMESRAHFRITGGNLYASGMLVSWQNVNIASNVLIEVLYFYWRMCTRLCNTAPQVWPISQNPWLVRWNIYSTSPAFDANSVS